ncbi:hemophore-related protein [Mycolicibacterium neworleansense]|uniref:Low molecular weight T-cell antigen TB8.4 n=1 Tax=Mycolicibacterium neworleansense TaxID=146018 RepID=A0A0H5RYK0_9MYCO|nr:hemophore-related protein [Mycolicibacterium neworleansense]MCV7363667.1 hemophore-related protein [Mycolicibacterium neworleansense]CRZ19013.1 low molecular weight T-cell antigen TB8.4 [Mycolicibacterium neworleansense]
MMKLSSATVAIAAGALTMSLSVGAGIASADPRLESAVNTTCSYSQVMGALNAQSPMAGASPAVQSVLQQFLDAPRDQRQRMAEGIAAQPANQPYLGLLQTVFDTCNNF